MFVLQHKVIHDCLGPSILFYSLLNFIVKYCPSSPRPPLLNVCFLFLIENKENIQNFQKNSLIFFKSKF